MLIKVNRPIIGYNDQIKLVDGHFLTKIRDNKVARLVITQSPKNKKLVKDLKDVASGI